MRFADAHSDFGILTYLAGKSEVQSHLVDDFAAQMQKAPVSLSLIQMGGDFEHSGYDFGDSKTVLKNLKHFKNEVIPRFPFLEIVFSGDDLNRVIANNRSAIILSIEGSRAIDSMESLDLLYEEGIRSMAITHDYQNRYGCGCRVAEDTGLTTHGEKLLDYAAEKGMILDLVHVGERTFMDAVEYYQRSVFVSHSNSNTVFDDARNITDEQILAIHERNGVVAVNFISEFLDAEPGAAPLGRLVDHIEHIASLTSVGTVALGPDFFRYLMPDLDYVGNVNGPADLPLVVSALEKGGFSLPDIQRICFENLERFMRSSL